MRRFLEELRRRNVYKVGVAYLVAAFVVVQVADLAAGAFGLPDWFEPLVWVLCALGLPLALVLAWTYDLTVDGVHRTPADPGADTGQSAPSGAGTHPGSGAAIQRLGGLQIAGLVLVTASLFAGWLLLGRSDTIEVRDRSVAVMPFGSVGGDQGAQLAEGVHGDLLTRLSNVSDLRVISRTSMNRYRETRKSLPEIANELDVRWVVEGTVQQADGRVRVNAQLIHAPDDNHRWARTYERDLTAASLFDLQSELAKQVVRSLQAEMSAGERARMERAPTQNLEAYRLYVQGLTHLDRRTPAGLRRGLELFRDAIARDSTYALAWAGLAEAQLLLASYGHASPDSMYTTAAEAGRQALALDPDLAEAHAVLGQLYAESGDVPAAIRQLEQALELNPNYARAHSWLAGLAGAMGRPEEALRHTRRAVELDPQSSLDQLLHGWALWWAEGAGEQALHHIRKAAELEPAFSFAHIDEGLILSLTGRHAEAIRALERGLELAEPETFAWEIGTGVLGWAYVAIGDTTAARGLATRLAEVGGALGEAMIHAALGQEVDALRALETVQWNHTKLWDLRALTVFDPLRDDPRYHDLLDDIQAELGIEVQSDTLR